MSDEAQRNASVRLEAEVDPYSRGVSQATKDTNLLAASVDKLATKLDGITKRAGKKLILFGAGGAAGIGALTAEAASFEKKLSTLNATAAITDKTMSGLTKNVTSLSKQFPITRDEAIQLVTVLDKLGLTSTKQIGRVAESMVKLSAATGEDAIGLSHGMVELSRQMGTLESGTMDRFSNSLLVLSKNAGVSATGVLNFASAIAPTARAAGLSQQQVLGVATAFQRAGADGYAAANTFNTMLADITRQVVTGSPEIAKYSNLIGVTTEQFKRMDPAEAVASIFEEINKQGPGAIKTLDRLGYDGVRMMRSIQAAVQSGGLREAIEMSTNAYGSTRELDKASGAAMDGLSDAMVKNRTAMEALATTAGGPFLGAFTAAFEVTAKLLGGLNEMAAVVAPLGALLGTVLSGGALLIGGTLAASKVMSMAALGGGVLRSAPAQAFRGGIGASRGESNLWTARMANSEAWRRDMAAWRAGGGVGPAPAAPGPVMRWWQQPGFMAGQAVGDWMNRRSGGGMGLGRSFAMSPLTIARGLMDAQRGFYQDLGRPGYARQATFLGGLGNLARAVTHPREFAEGYRASSGTSMAAGAAKTPQEFGAAMKYGTAQALASAGAHKSLAAASGQLVGSFLKLNGSMVAAGTRTIAGGAVAAGKGIGGALIGMAGGNPYAAGAVAIGAGAYYANKIHDQGEQRRYTVDNEQPIGRYNAALGIATERLGEFSFAMKDARDSLPKPESFADVRKVSPEVVNVGMSSRRLTSPDAKLYGTSVKGMTNFLNALGISDPRQLQEAQIDLVNLTGGDTARVQKAVDAYFKNRRRAGTARSGVDYESLNEQTTPMQRRSELFGVPIGMAWSGSDQAMKLTQQALQEVRRDFQVNLRDRGPAYANQVQASEMLGFVGANLPDRKESEMVDDFGGWWEYQKSKSAQQATDAVGQFEKMFLKGGNANFGFTTVKEMRSELGEDMDNPQKRAEFLIDWIREHGDRKAKKVLASYEDQGIQFSQLSRRELTDLAMESESEYTRGLKAQGTIGRYALNNPEVRRGVARPGDVNAQYEAITGLLNRASQLGKTFAGTDAELQKLKASIKDKDNPLYQYAEAAQQMNATRRDDAMRYMGRTQRIGAVVQDFRSVLNEDSEAPDHRQRLEARKASLREAKASYYEYMVSLVQATREFGIQRTRAEEDYERSVRYSNADFNLSLARAEEDYYTTRLRANRDFGIAMAQQTEDFNISMARSNEDFQRSLSRMAEDAAKTVYDPFSRIQMEWTSSVGTVMENLLTQNQRIERQISNVRRLRKMGLSQEAVDTLQLGDPKNAQQVDRLVEDIKEDPNAIKRINKQVKRRQKATEELTQSGDLNEEYRRMVADFHRQQARATADFERGQARAAAAHGRAMADMADDFGKATSRAVADHDKALRRMGKSYELQMTRSREDLARMADQVFGSFGKVMARAVNQIRRQLGPLGADIIDELDKIKAKYPEFFSKDPTATAPAGRTTPGGTRGGSADSIDRPRRHALGGVAVSHRIAEIAEEGPEAIIPLNHRGVAFMGAFTSEVTRSVLRDLHTVATPVSYRGQKMLIDNSVTYTGDISVRADDARAMERKLAERARMKRLTRPRSSISGG